MFKARGNGGSSTTCFLNLTAITHVWVSCHGPITFHFFFFFSPPTVRIRCQLMEHINVAAGKYVKVRVFWEGWLIWFDARSRFSTIHLPSYCLFFVGIYFDVPSYRRWTAADTLWLMIMSGKKNMLMNCTLVTAHSPDEEFWRDPGLLSDWPGGQRVGVWHRTSVTEL